MATAAEVAALKKLAEDKEFRVCKITPPRPTLRCKSCGETGQAGNYPFSTLPGSGRCDDCV